MFNKYRDAQFAAYRSAKEFFLKNPSVLADLERYFADRLVRLLQDHLQEIVRDYDEASSLYPFWQNYPPDDRGRQPRGDQFPWIEVGEHTIGSKLSRLLPKYGFAIRDTGLPTGPDERFVVTHKDIAQITRNLTDSAWLFVDIKSVGPRDDFDHAVMSHNQVSGDGVWTGSSSGVKNKVMTAQGARQSHDFHCTLPPLYVLSDGLVVPTVLTVIKPVYTMLSSGRAADDGGQPLERLTVVAIPNGLLMYENPGYLRMHPGLLYPGKDDKEKNPLKVRARISFSLLNKIAPWRVTTIKVR